MPNALPIAAFVRDDAWTYPALETIHIIGIGLIFGSILAYDLRVLGWHRALSLRLLARHLLPWVWAGFALNATSGALLFVSDAIEFAANPALQAKLLLIGLAGVNAAAFQLRLARGQEAWDMDAQSPPAARASAAFSIILWLAIITAGRLMAYVG
jgi:hypothetical protein